MRAFFFCLLFLATILPIKGQQEIDSLERCLSTKLHDTTKLNVLLRLADHFRFAEPKKGKEYALKAITASKENNNQKALGDAYHFLASSYFQVASYDSSEAVNQRALAIRLKINDEKGLAGSYINLGQLYADKGKTEIAFDYFHRAEKIYEKLKMERHLGIVYNSIGNLYYGQKLYELAYSYMQKSLSVKNKLGDSYGAIASLNNLGHITYYLYGPDSAKRYYEASATAALGVGDVYTQIQSLNNLGTFYMDVRDTEKAISTIKRAISIGEGTEYEEILANAYMNYAKLLMQTKKDQKQALFYALKAEKMINAANLPEQIYQAKNVIASLYASFENYRLAYEYMDNAYRMKDTFIRSSVQKQMSDLETKYQTEKKQLEITNLKQKETLNETELKRKNLQLILFLIFSLFLLVMGYIVLKAYRLKKKANLLIQQQKEEVETQKDLVEEKNKEILDSIHYAQRIQQSLLPTEKYIDKSLKRLKK